jgi:hypothetical protein
VKTPLRRGFSFVLVVKFGMWNPAAAIGTISPLVAGGGGIGD